MAFIWQWSLQRKILTIFSLIALLLITIIIITFGTVFSYREKRDLVTHTNQVLDKLDATSSAVKDAET